LPWGEAGNSEVGHLTIGAGKIIYNHLPRIISAIQDETFFTNEAFSKAADHVKTNKSSLHIMGLFSSGSVHAYAEHLYALLDFSKRQELTNVFLHLFTDGRDAPPYEGAKFIGRLEARLKDDYPNIRIASVIGRYYAMDREGRWKDIEKTYNLLTAGAGEPFASASSYIEEGYKKDLSDEFITPGIAKISGNDPLQGRIKDNDAIIYFNYREDSAAELTEAFTAENFNNFPRKKLNNIVFATMTKYNDKLQTLIAFPLWQSGAPWRKYWRKPD